MHRKIVIRPGMSRHQIRNQLQRAFNDAVNNSHFEWTCIHGHRHRIRIGSIPKGAKRRLWCGCSITGR